LTGLLPHSKAKANNLACRRDIEDQRRTTVWWSFVRSGGTGWRRGRKPAATMLALSRLGETGRRARRNRRERLRYVNPLATKALSEAAENRVFFPTAPQSHSREFHWAVVVAMASVRMMEMAVD
jgi:hypothetical protein